MHVFLLLLLVICLLSVWEVRFYWWAVLAVFVESLLFVSIALPTFGDDCAFVLELE